MVALDDATPGWPTEDRAFVHAATELLKAGEYERLADLLERARKACALEGDVIPAQALDLARRICLACSQSHAEAEWHWQAREEVTQREDQLRDQLDALLHLDREGDSGLPAPRLQERSERLSLRQRIEGVLHWRLGPQSPVQAASQAPAPPMEERALPPQEPEPEAARATPARPEAYETPGPPSLVIHCLGPFRVYNSLNLIEKWPGLKCKSIFKYMIFHRRNPIHREVLVELFWPDAELDAGCRNLYQAIYTLRRALRAGGDPFPYILCEDSCYEINPELHLWIDSEEFLSHHARGQKLEREGRLEEAVTEYELAENLYEGEFLSEDRYEDWPVIERENLKHTHIDVLDRLSRFYFEQAHYNVSVAFCQSILAEDNCREDIHRRLMRCFFHCDQLHLAIRQYHTCVKTLNRELDVPPMPATVELYQQIRRARVQVPSG